MSFFNFGLKEILGTNEQFLYKIGSPFLDILDFLHKSAESTWVSLSVEGPFGPVTDTVEPFLAGGRLGLSRHVHRI